MYFRNIHLQLSFLPLSSETVSETCLGRWGRRISNTVTSSTDGVTFLPAPASPLPQSGRSASPQLQSDLGLLRPYTSSWPSCSSPGLPGGTGSNPYPGPPVGKDITYFPGVRKEKAFSPSIQIGPPIHLCLSRAGLWPHPPSPQPPF